MTLKHINIFIEVCKTLNITKAAKNLYMTQPAVSLAIKELEEELNISLFIRNKGRLNLSLDGKRLFVKALEINQSIEEFYLEADNSTKQIPIHIGSSLSFGTYYLPKIIKELKNDFLYDIKIEPCNLILEEIQNGTLDIAFIEDDSIVSSFEEIKLLEDHLVIVGTKELMLKYQESDFSNIPLMVRNENSGTRVVLDHEIQKINNKPTFTVISNTNEALIQYAINSIGFAVVPYCSVKKHLEENKLVEYKPQGFNLSRQIRAVYLKNKKLNEDLEKFIAIIKQHKY